MEKYSLLWLALPRSMPWWFCQTWLGEPVFGSTFLGQIPPEDFGLFFPRKMATGTGPARDSVLKKIALGRPWTKKNRDKDSSSASQADPGLCSGVSQGAEENRDTSSLEKQVKK